MRTMSIFAGLGTDSVTSLDTFWCSGTVFPPSRCTHLVRSNHRWAQKPLRLTLHKKMHKKFTTEMSEKMYHAKSEKREPNLGAAFAHRAASRNFAPNAFSAPRKSDCRSEAWDISSLKQHEIPKMSTWNTMKQNTQRNQGFSNKIQTFRISHEICRYAVNFKSMSQGAAEELGCSSPSGHVLGCFWPRWYQVGPQTLSVFSSNRPIGRFRWLFRCFPQVTGVTGLLTCKMAESSSSVESVFNGKNRCFEHLKVI